MVLVQANWVVMTVCSIVVQILELLLELHLLLVVAVVVTSNGCNNNNSCSSARHLIDSVDVRIVLVLMVVVILELS